MEVLVTDRSDQKVTLFEIDGYRIPLVPGGDLEQGLTIFKNLPHFPCRPDDVLLLSFPKTGTNWLFEIMMMMLNGRAERVMQNKIQSMLELLPQDEIDTLESPRVLNTHVSPKYIPADVARLQLKTVLVLRNPKDTAVSFYNHMTGIKQYEYSGKWDDWLPLYLDGKFEYGTYEDYLQEWGRVLDDQNRTFPIHVVYYEDLKENCLPELRRLANFLGLQVSDPLLRDIETQCSFKAMKENKLPDVVKEQVFTEDFGFFRKGEVGDWINWFSAEQADLLDKLWAERMGTNSRWRFKFTLPATRSKL